MVEIKYSNEFLKKIKKIKDGNLKNKIKKLIVKIIESPDIGKPMRFTRKGTRELYVSPFRLAYTYNIDTVTFLDFYHKDIQ